jgi:hypothetical protein
MVEMPRRTLLAGGAGLLGLVIVGIGVEDAAAATASGPLRADYARSVGQTFTAARAGHTYRLTLQHIRDLIPTTAERRPHCFNLIFVPGGTAAVADGIYTLSSRGVPTRSLFLSRVGTGHSMQALVNRKA